MATRKRKRSATPPTAPLRRSTRRRTATNGGKDDNGAGKRVTLWHKTERRKLCGMAAPKAGNVANYLREHPEWEVYCGQAKKRHKKAPTKQPSPPKKAAATVTSPRDVLRVDLASSAPRRYVHQNPPDPDDIRPSPARTTSISDTSSSPESSDDAAMCSDSADDLEDVKARLERMEYMVTTRLLRVETKQDQILALLQTLSAPPPEPHKSKRRKEVGSKAKAKAKSKTKIKIKTKTALQKRRVVLPAARSRSSVDKVKRAKRPVERKKRPKAVERKKRRPLRKSEENGGSRNGADDGDGSDDDDDDDDDEPLRVQLWHKAEKRKLVGNAAPMRKNISKYLDKHPEWELYDDQDKEVEVVERKKRRRVRSGGGRVSKSWELAGVVDFSCANWRADADCDVFG